MGTKIDASSLIEPYIVYYLILGQNENYWNNELALGAGFRSKPFTSFEASSWANEWIKDVKFYTEILSLSFLKDETTAKANNVKTNDFRIGIDIWHEWNLSNINYNVCWAELWERCDYRNTNFFDPASGIDKFQSYLNYTQLKIGRHFAGGIRPYIATYLTLSGVKKVWLNNFYYGLGLRMEPFLEQENAPELLRKFKMFVEALNIAWLAEQDPTRPVNDFRFGIEFTYGR